MRFAVGFPPDDVNFKLSQGGWQEISLVTEAKQIFLIYLILSIASVYFILKLPNSLSIGSVLFIFIILIPIHEIAHLIGFPDHGFSDKSYIFILFRKFCCYAYYQGPLSRNRFLLISASPIVLLTLLPVLFFFIFLEDKPLWLLYVSAFNLSFSVLDMINIYYLLRLIPRKAIIRHHRGKRYWRTEKG